MEIIKDGIKHILFPYQFRPLQKVVVETMGRFCILVAHRRFGKTLMVLLHMILSSMTNERKNSKYWYICPQEKQARKNGWDYLKTFANFLPNAQTNEGRLELTYDLEDGKGLRTIGLRGVDKGGDSLRGSYLDGVVLDEMKDMPMSVWTQVVSPMLSDRKGWAILTGTVGQGPWYDLYTKESNNKDSIFKTFLFKASESKVIDDDELQQQRRIMGDRNFRREYECDWMAIEEGSYYGDIISGLDDIGQLNITTVHNPQKPVYTSWDLGAADATAIWFFQEGDADECWNVIDYLELTRAEMQENGQSTYGKSFDSLMYNKILEKHYLYAAHVLPHDAVHKYGSAEFSTYEKFKSFSNSTQIIVAKKTTTEARIDTVQHMLHKFTFNKVLCSKGISALHSYRAKMTGDGTETSPNHNWASHGADSFGYFCHSVPLLKSTRNKFNRTQKKSTSTIGSYNPLK